MKLMRLTSVGTLSASYKQERQVESPGFCIDLHKKNGAGCDCFAICDVTYNEATGCVDITVFNNGDATKVAAVYSIGADGKGATV